MIKIKKENILNCNENIIVQQVNCQGVMGAGLAKQIRNKYPKVYKEYKEFCLDFTLKSDMLGKCLKVVVDNDKFVANIFGQLTYGRNGIYTRYDRLKEGLVDIGNFAKRHNYSIAIPYGIGCGLAGGEWEFVAEIIYGLFKESDINVTIYKI